MGRLVEPWCEALGSPGYFGTDNPPWVEGMDLSPSVREGFDCHNPTKKDNTGHGTCPGTVTAGAFISTASPVPLKKMARGTWRAGGPPTPWKIPCC